MEASVREAVGLVHSDSLRRSAVCREVEICLLTSSYLALRDVTCAEHDGEIHLHGTLPSHYLKQVAQSIAIGTDGVRRVSNHIEVVGQSGLAPVRLDRAANAARRTD